MIPADHPSYIFPYNLEDRVKHMISKLIKIINRNIDYKTIKGKNGSFLNETGLPSYRIEFNDNKYTQSVKKELEKDNFVLKNKKWSIILD